MIQALPDGRLGLVVNDIRNLVSGNIVSGEVTPQIQAAAEKANAHEFIMEMDHGYDSEVGEGGSLFRAEYKTFREVFSAVYVFPRHDRAEQDAGSPAWWRRTRNLFLAATLGEQRTKADVTAQAERLWGALGTADFNLRLVRA